MTAITYFCCRIIEDPRNATLPLEGQNPPRVDFVWREIVTGDLESRKEEIRQEHKKNNRWGVYTPILEAIFYDKYQINDYLEFEI